MKRVPDSAFTGVGGGNLIWTDSGYKKIEDIKCFDKVYTPIGNLDTVIQTKRTSNYHNVEIKMAGCEPIVVHEDHLFLARKKGVLYGRHDDGRRFANLKLNEPCLIPANELTNDYRVAVPINKESILPIWRGVEKTTMNGRGITNRWVENTLGRYMDNEDFWWIVGRYIGDGYLSKDKKIVEICCNYKEIDDIKERTDKLGIKYTTREKGDTFSYLYSSKELCEFLARYGIGSLNKSIIPEIINLPIPLLQSFLDGYISADGHWDYSLENPYCTVTTVSRTLIYGYLQSILKAYGRWGSLTVNNNQNDYICGRHINANDSYAVSFYKNKTIRFQYTIENGYAWINVRDVAKHNKQTPIYSFLTEHGDGMVVNNVAMFNNSIEKDISEQYIFRENLTTNQELTNRDTN